MGWEFYVDRRMLYNVVVENVCMAEQRLQIHAFPLRNSYRKEEMKCIGCIPGNNNITDVQNEEILTTNQQ